jgi:hypothetical protein
MGPEANVLHFAVRISYDFRTVGSYLSLSATENFSLFTLRAITWTGQALLLFESESKKVLGLLWAELHPSTFSSMAKRREHYRPRHHGTGVRIRL